MKKDKHDSRNSSSTQITEKEKEQIQTISKVLYAAVACAGLACTIMVGSFIYSKDISFESRERDKFITEQLIKTIEIQSNNSVAIAELSVGQGNLSRDVDKLYQSVDNLINLQREKRKLQ